MLVKHGCLCAMCQTPNLTYYVDRNWDSIRHSVGNYKLEEEDARLFSRI